MTAAERDVVKLESLQELKKFILESKLPVLISGKKKGKKLTLRFPNEEKHEAFVLAGQPSAPEWKPYRAWAVARSKMQSHAERCMAKWGGCWVVQTYNEREVCAPACQNAIGLECECSCMGLHHGHGATSGKWYVVNEAFCVRWHEVIYAVRRISPVPRPKLAPTPPFVPAAAATELAVRLRAEQEEALRGRQCAVDDFLK